MNSLASRRHDPSGQNSSFIFKESTIVYSCSLIVKKAWKGTVVRWIHALSKTPIYSPPQTVSCEGLSVQKTSVQSRFCNRDPHLIASHCSGLKSVYHQQWDHKISSVIMTELVINLLLNLTKTTSFLFWLSLVSSLTLMINLYFRPVITGYLSGNLSHVFQVWYVWFLLAHMQIPRWRACDGPCLQKYRKIKFKKGTETENRHYQPIRQCRWGKWAIKNDAGPYKRAKSYVSEY